MDKDSTQPQSEQEQELNQLRQLLSETLSAEEFFQSAAGNLWVRLATTEINKLIKDITSDKYLKDHNGYVNANIELGVWRKMLHKMQIAASPIRKGKIEERIAENESAE